MKILKITFYLLLVLLSINNVIYAQILNPEKEKITKNISDYFNLDRETIHLHIDKTVFLSNEEIWFKGYVLDRKNSIPFEKTTNIYASILNENGIKITQKLLFSNLGTFSGNFKLNKDFKTGDYYIQVYTNWMNNFIEDESFTTKIKILNENDISIPDFTAINLSKINIEINPEGGKFVLDIENNCGVRITDCNNNPITIEDCEIIDSKGITLRQFKTNKFGYGKFRIIPTNEIYKIRVTYQDKKTEIEIPKAEQTGVLLEINNIALSNKTIVKIKTNQKTLQELQQKPLLLLIQQDDKSDFINVNFQNQNIEQELFIANDSFFDGINSIRLIDNQKKLYSERIIFNIFENQPKLEIFKQSITGNKINLSGNIDVLNSNLSISVLPTNTVSIFNNTDIFASFLLNPYLKERIIDGKYYFNNIDNVKKNELDLMLLNQKYKYNWNDIINNPPIEKYEFDRGLNIKGTVNQVVNRENYKIRAYCLPAQILDFSEINEKDEFYFKNFVVADSTKINFGLLKKVDLKPIDLKYYALVENKIRNFNKILILNQSFCDTIKNNKSFSKMDMPRLKKNEILLSEVKVVGNKNALKNENIQGNSRLRGYKITDFDANTDLLDYISFHGFEVDKNPTEVNIHPKVRGVNFASSRSQKELLKDYHSTVYINDMNYTNLNDLFGMKMSEVDEIYFSESYLSNYSERNGLIKIYLKKPKPLKIHTNSFLVTGGFEITRNFKNQQYSAIDKGFNNFGVLNFISNSKPNENGNFNFDIPNFYQKSVKVLIEGFSNDGKIFSEIKEVSIE